MTNSARTANLSSDPDLADPIGSLGFKDTPEPPPSRPPHSSSRKASHRTGFISRPTVAPAVAQPRRSKRQPTTQVATTAAAEAQTAAPSRSTVHRWRTGRTQQFSTKFRPETIARLTAIADAQGWRLSEVIEHALEELDR